MQMLQDRTTVLPAFADELARFSRLVRALDASQMERPSRCEGWTAGDVARHFVGTIADIAAGRIEGQGTPEVTERQVRERKGRSGAELADELDAAASALAPLFASIDDNAWNAPAGGGFDGTLGFGVEALLYDAVVHEDDIAEATGAPTERTPEGTVACVSHVAHFLDERGWGPATLELDGVPVVEIGGGGDRRVTGDPFTFVLAATGRHDPVAVGADESVNIYA